MTLEELIAQFLYFNCDCVSGCTHFSKWDAAHNLDNRKTFNGKALALLEYLREHEYIVLDMGGPD